MATPVRIGIIGAGITGSSAAYFLREALGESAEIVVLERSHDIGGRIAQVELDGSPLETGAVFSTSLGQYIVDFVDRLHLQQELCSPSESQRRVGSRDVKRSAAPLGFWDGRRLATPGARPEWSSKARLMYRYGFSVSRVPLLAQEVTAGMECMYQMQKAGQWFRSPEMLLRSAGLYGLTQQTTLEFYRSHKISDRFRQEIANGVGRLCYGLGDSLNALANLLCVMCGAELHGHMFTVYEGNVEMCRGLLRIAQAQMQLGARAIAVRVEPDVPDTRALHLIIENSARTETFDAIIVATPLEHASIAFFGFDPSPTAHRQREYRVMHVTHISGHVNPAYFRKQHLWEIPPVILTADGRDTQFWGMGTVPRAGKEESVYKIYSEHALSEHTLSQLFTRHTVVHHIERNAFPLLTPVHGWPPFILGPGLYYANAMEWAVSSMEMQAIASRNVVNALVEDLRLVGAPN